MVFGCFWCYLDAELSLIDTPSCESDRTCYGGVLGRGNPFLLPHKGRKKAKERKMFTILGFKLNKMTLIVASFALGVLVLISVVTICCLCRRRNKSGEEFQTMDMFAVEEQPQLMGPTDVLTNDPTFAPLQLNYPGQSTVMQSNMQMRLGGPRLSYSTQAMSGMWPQGYAQSQLMSFGPQMSAMQTPVAYPRTLMSPSAMQTPGGHPRTLKSPSAMQAAGAYPRTLKSSSAMQTPGAHPRTLMSPSGMQTAGAYPRTAKSPSAMQTPEAYPRTPKSKKSKPMKTRKVSFSNDDQYGIQEEPNAVFEDSSAAQGSEVSSNSEAEVIEDIAVTEEDGGL